MTCRKAKSTSPVFERAVVRALPWLLLLLLVSGGHADTYLLGDSTGTVLEGLINHEVRANRLTSGANAGELDSVRVWHYKAGGASTDTLVACIYNQARTLLARSDDSVLGSTADYTAYMLHFTAQSITIAASTTYWIGWQCRSGGSGSMAVMNDANTDTLWWGRTDTLPLGDLTGGYFDPPTGGSADRNTLRLTGYYSSTGGAASGSRRPRLMKMGND